MTASRTRRSRSLSWCAISSNILTTSSVGQVHREGVQTQPAEGGELAGDRPRSWPSPRRVQRAVCARNSSVKTRPSVVRNPMYARSESTSAGASSFLAIRRVDSGAEATQPLGVRAHVPATPLAVEAVRSRPDRGVGHVPPVARVVSRAGAGQRVVRHLVVLEARRGERSSRRAENPLVARVGGLARAAPRSRQCPSGVCGSTVSPYSDR